MQKSLEDYQNLLTHIVTPLLGNEDGLKIRAEEKNGGYSFLVETHPDDVGRVIGKGGSTISSLRSIIDFVAGQNDDCVVFDLKND